MKAVIYPAGDTGILTLREAPVPEPGPMQVRVRVAASALNRADILQRRGRYPAPPGWPPDIPGLEYAGEVDTVGPGVTRWKKGDRIMGLVGGGAHAEFVVVHENEALMMPVGLSYSEAAAIPEAFLTAWDALVTRGRLQPGERVLIHAVGSGVGTAAVQVAKRLGAVTVGTSRSADKLERARALGLDEAIWTGGAGDSKSRAAGGFRDRLSAPVHVILDVLGGPALAENLDALAPRGRLVLLGFLQGPKAEVNLDPLLRKRLEVIGSVMRSRGSEERAALAAEFSTHVLPAFVGADTGTGGAHMPSLRPVVAATFSFTAISDAHAAMERDENFGKIVLIW